MMCACNIRSRGAEHVLMSASEQCHQSHRNHLEQEEGMYRNVCVCVCVCVCVFMCVHVLSCAGVPMFYTNACCISRLTYGCT